MNELLAKFRASGWAVAVHNDYRLNGVDHTFWLFTQGNAAVKGEGTSDEEALTECLREVHRLDQETKAKRLEFEALEYLSQHGVQCGRTGGVVSCAYYSGGVRCQSTYPNYFEAAQALQGV